MSQATPAESEFTCQACGQPGKILYVMGSEFRVCTICDAMRAKEQHQKYDANANVWLKSIGVPDILLNARLSDLDGAYDVTKSHYLFGKPGRGKSHLATGMLRAYYMRCGPDNEPYAEFITVLDLHNKMKATFNKAATETQEDMIKRYAGITVLVLDDMEAEQTVFGYTVLQSLLDKRMSNRMQTIFTSNDAWEDIKAEMPPRLTSRIGAITKGCHVHVGNGQPDRRLL